MIVNAKLQRVLVEWSGPRTRQRYMDVVHEALEEYNEVAAQNKSYFVYKNKYVKSSHHVYFNISRGTTLNDLHLCIG